MCVCMCMCVCACVCACAPARAHFKEAHSIDITALATTLHGESAPAILRKPTLTD